MAEVTDHDILTTLVANVQNMKESQDKFHQDMKDQFADLKNNYKQRLDKHDEIIEGLATKIELEAVIQKLENVTSWSYKITGGLFVINIILGFVAIYLSSKH